MVTLPVVAECCKKGKYLKWRPHQDSNLDRPLRRRLLYPVELWEHEREYI